MDDTLSEGKGNIIITILGTIPLLDDVVVVSSFQFRQVWNFRRLLSFLTIGIMYDVPGTVYCLLYHVIYLYDMYDRMIGDDTTCTRKYIDDYINRSVPCCVWCIFICASTHQTKIVRTRQSVIKSIKHTHPRSVSCDISKRQICTFKYNLYVHTYLVYKQRQFNTPSFL